MKFDPRRIVTQVASAFVWRGALSIEAGEIANRLAEGLYDGLIVYDQMSFLKLIINK